ncbi:glycosyltransferase [Serratia sp. BFP-2025]|uniref:glycosyltransferase n=1 Tax=Serratia sp. BFP-2025 TaxID=3433707 RepID=UPI003D7E54F3
MHIIESSATGTLSVVTMLANSQVKSNNDVCVIYSRRDDTPENIASLFDPRIELVEVDMAMRKFPTSCIVLRKIITERSPNIVHLHSSLAGFVGRLANIGNKKNRIIYSPHCISFMRKDIGKTKEYVFKTLERIANFIPSTYVACSKSEYDSIKSNLSIKNVEVINNAYDGESSFELSISDLDIKNKKKVEIITVGGIRNQKDPASFSLLAKSLINKSVNFTWVGDGDHNLKNLLQEAGVNVTGWLPKTEVLKLVRKSDIYVSTARWEGMPISILESMASGVPVVAKNCAGNNDLIKNRKNGYLFDELDEAIVAIQLLIENDKIRRSIILTALEDIKREYSLTGYVNKMQCLYERRLASLN